MTTPSATVGLHIDAQETWLDALPDAGCHGLPPEWFFPERDEGRDNHGDQAKAACVGCPIRAVCLDAAVARNEPAGIWGGAGEARRRQLRKVRPNGPLYAATLAAHFRQLEGKVLGADERLLLQVFGAGATHGKRCTQAKGCRCEPCLMAASFEGVVKTMRRRPAQRRSAVAA